MGWVKFAALAVLAGIAGFILSAISSLPISGLAKVILLTVMLVSFLFVAGLIVFAKPEIGRELIADRMKPAIPAKTASAANFTQPMS